MKISLTVWLATGLLLLLGQGAMAQEGGLDPFAHENGVPQGGETESLRFSNTAHWTEKPERYRQGEVVYIPGWQRHVVLPKPPANSSRRTELELAQLLHHQEERTEEQVEEIRAEIDLPGFFWGELRYDELIDEASHPATRKLLLAANHDLCVVVFTLKHHFDRVRPSLLDTRLQPCITIPGHPAYPSGHATQAHVFGYLFQELAPEQGEVIRRDAARIAHNREIAGVHYPSDSEAGRLLARQLVDLMLANPEFQKLLDDARSEW